MVLFRRQLALEQQHVPAAPAATGRHGLCSGGDTGGVEGGCESPLAIEHLWWL